LVARMANVSMLAFEGYQLSWWSALAKLRAGRLPPILE
jgi:hypothetical protein